MLNRIKKMFSNKKASRSSLAALHPLKALKFLGIGLLAIPAGVFLNRTLKGRRM